MLLVYVFNDWILNRLENPVYLEEFREELLKAVRLLKPRAYVTMFPVHELTIMHSTLALYGPSE